LPRHSASGLRWRPQRRVRLFEGSRAWRRTCVAGPPVLPVAGRPALGGGPAVAAGEAWVDLQGAFSCATRPAPSFGVHGSRLPMAAAGVGGFRQAGFLRGALSWPGLWLAREGWFLARLSRGASLRLAMGTETSRAAMPASPRRGAGRQARSPGELFAAGLVYGDSRLAASSYLQGRAGRPL